MLLVRPLDVGGRYLVRRTRARTNAAARSTCHCIIAKFRSSVNRTTPACPLRTPRGARWPRRLHGPLLWGRVVRLLWPYAFIRLPACGRAQLLRRGRAPRCVGAAFSGARAADRAVCCLPCGHGGVGHGLGGPAPGGVVAGSSVAAACAPPVCAGGACLCWAVGCGRRGARGGVCVLPGAWC